MVPGTTPSAQATVVLRRTSGVTVHCAGSVDQGYGRGGTPIFTDVFEPLARVVLYSTDEDGLGTWFAAA